MHDRTCPECGAAFSPRTGGQVCCSNKCTKVRNRRLAQEAKQRREEFEREQSKAAVGRRDMKRRLARRDLAYNALQVPVSTRVVNGVSVEWRGQPRLGCCAVSHVSHNS